MSPASSLLLGPASLDRYLTQDVVLPGGGALNMAYHWSRLRLPYRFLTRIGDDSPEVFTRFLDRWEIACTPSLVGHGPSASIDIVIEADRQPFMDHFVEGVWTDFRLTMDEEALIAQADRLHVVLVEAAAAELHRLGDAGALAHLSVSGDFLGFRHYSVERFAATMAHLDLGFIGWPGAVDDPVLDGLREATWRLGKLLVVTLGSRGVLVVDGRADRDERSFAVDAVRVEGTTVGCGDAFIAAFLARWWSDGDVDGAVDAGRRAGAEATRWMRPLPDEAYGESGHVAG